MSERAFFCQNVTITITPGRDALPVNCCGSTSSNNQHLQEINNHYRTLPEDADKSQCEEQQSEENKFFILPREYEIDAKPVKREFTMQPTEGINIGNNGRDLHDAFMDVADNPLPGDELYLNDSYSVECPDGFNVEDYLTFSDTDDGNLMAHDSSQLMMTSDYTISGEPFQSLEVSISLECPSSLALYPQYLQV